LMKHTIVALMEDHPGVLNRVVSLFRRRAYNIDSLVVGQTERPGISRMTVVVNGGDVEQVTKQLYRVIEVLNVTDVTHERTIQREIVLIKLHIERAERAEVLALCSVFGARAVDVGPQSMVVELTARPDTIDRFLETVRPFGIKEMTRTGRVAMLRDGETASPPDPQDSGAPARAPEPTAG
jgi:acetolactate synthase I/III small subunit